MGGKPFTSRGCHICRRRKVKCDEQKPQCATCLRRGVECPGYERENGVFIHHKNDRDPSSKPVKKPTLKLVQSHHPPSNLQISTKPLGQHAVRDQIFASFYAMYFPKNGYVSRVNPWQFLVANFKSIAQKSPMLEKAVFAVASLYVGKVKDDLRVSNHGQRVYNEAIWLLRNKIQAGSYDSDIIYTTYVFQEIEQFHISLRHEAYFAHLDGMKRILNYYSTRVVNDPFANRIHTNQPRFTMYLAATGVKQPVGKYEAVPPATGFDLYDQFLELLDAVISFAGVLASAMDSETCNQETRNSILDGCVELEAKWTGWFMQSGLDESYTYALPNEIFTSELSATDSLFGRAYQFDTHDSAILYAWSFECMIRVMKLTHKARAYSLSEEGTAPSGELDSEGLRKLEFYADKICLAIPFCAHDDMGPSGLHSPMLPICTAALAYVDLGQREKFSWCQQALQVGANRHISTATFFKEICGERFKESGLDCNSQDVSVSTKENNEHCQIERVVDVSEEA